MKNLLNEEINQIKYLLNYNRGLVLSEQKNVINEDTATGGLGGEWNPSTGEYTIVKGDTLSKIGKAFGVKWMDIWEENKDTLRSGKPNCGKYCGYNWIFVGEVVTIPGKAEAPVTTNTNDTSTETTDAASGEATAAAATSTEPAVVTGTTTSNEEPKTKREIRRDCRAEAEKQGLKKLTKARREFMRKCKSEGGTNADSDEENAPTEDEQTGSERRQERRKIRRNCRAEAKAKGLKGKEKREHIRKCKADGGEEGSETSVINNTTADQQLGDAPQEVTQYFEQLQTTDPYDILVNSKSDDREVAFKKAREDAQTQLGINYEPTLVGTRKVTSSSDGYNVYAAFKK
jgi:LysM repeat protein